MDSSDATWHRTVRRRALEGGALDEKARAELGWRAEELEEAVSRLRTEKEAAEDAAAALREELDAERGAAETAVSEALLMIGRLQREKAAAVGEAREFRRVADGRAGRDSALQDELAAVSELAAAYLALLRAHGVDPDDEGEDADGGEYDEEEEHYVEHVEAKADGMSLAGGDLEAESSPSPSTPPPPVEKELECTLEDVRCDAMSNTEGALYARVEALEADSAALRREVAAMRAERAQVVLAREVARRLCREAETTRAVVVAAERPHVSALAICKWFFSKILSEAKRYVSAIRLLPNHSSSPAFVLRLLPLLERSKGVRQIQNRTPEIGEPGVPWCSLLWRCFRYEAVRKHSRAHDPPVRHRSVGCDVATSRPVPPPRGGHAALLLSDERLQQ